MISPYALLKASKPKAPARVVTPYDLYSAMQHEPALPAQEPMPAPVLPPPAKKTHYIRDIGLKHNQALHRVSLTQAPLD